MEQSTFRRRWAEEEIARLLATLPSAIRVLASDLPVVLADYPGADAPGDDLLGLFTGYAHGEEGSDPALTQIELYLENIWAMADSSPAEFIAQVGITYLHELGHYLGWDEAEIAERGLE